MPSSDEVKQSITNWCSSDDDLEITSDRFEPGTDFAYGLKSGTLSSSPVDLVVLQDAGADRVTIRRSLTLSGDNVSAANQLIASRPGSVTAAVERLGGDTSVVAQTYVYLDGLSKHTFVQAVAELARTSTLLDAISSEVAATDDDTVLADMPDDGTTTDSVSDTVAAAATDDGSAAAAATAGAGSVALDVTGGMTPVTPVVAEPVPQVAVPQPVPTPTAIPTPVPLPQPSFTPQPAQPVMAQPAYTPQPVQQPYQPQPVQAQPAPQPAPAAQWVPSHAVPPQGLRAWGAPDPAGPVVANLAPGLPIQVAEVRGAWARVICSNGWTGWIDGRIIGVAA
jgi:hypothetical protein